LQLKSLTESTTFLPRPKKLLPDFPKLLPRLPKLLPDFPKLLPRLPKLLPRLPKLLPRLPKLLPRLQKLLPGLPKLRLRLQKVVRAILENRAWVQATPERAPNPDEAKAYLKISIGEERSMIWEWYNEMQDNDRLIRIRELMKALVWKRRKPTNR
jgi:hypothetical protein